MVAAPFSQDDAAPGVVDDRSGAAFCPLYLLSRQTENGKAVGRP